MMYYPIVGMFCGCITWLILWRIDVISRKYFKTNSRGSILLTPCNFYDRIMTPFKHKYIWRFEFWQDNWIIMCVYGAILEYVYHMENISKFLLIMICTGIYYLCTS